MSLIKVRHRITKREYNCSEEDFIKAIKKGAPLTRIGVVEIPQPSFARDGDKEPLDLPDGEPEAAKEANENKKTGSRKRKSGTSKANQNES